MFHRTAALNNVTKIREKHPGQHFVKHWKRANLWGTVSSLCLANTRCYMAHTNNNNGCLKFPEVPTGMKVLVKKLVYVYSQTVLSQTQARFTRDMNRFILPGYSGDLVNLEQMHFPKIFKLNTNNSTNRKPQFTRAAPIPEPANIGPQVVPRTSPSNVPRTSLGRPLKILFDHPGDVLK